MNPDLIEELLNEEESATLDFKSEQYPFIKATDDEKGELLKDILAFANAWRRTDAYILVGVNDVKGGRGAVVGITSDLDDASIQQFVNTKTNRNIEFSYKTVSVDDTKIGVFHIPLQERPFYIKKDFGKLKQKTVYIRRSSSTGEADIDEISKMGGTHFAENQSKVQQENLVLKTLQDEFMNNTTVLVELIHHKFDRPRFKSKIEEVNDLYAVFSSVSDGSKLVGAIKQITISYEPSLAMKLIIIASID